MSTAPENQDKRKARSLFQHGNEAMSKGNLDYALNMFREACKLDPGELPYRQMLRNVQRKKYENDPKKVGGLTRARVQGVRLKYRGAKGKGRWSEVLEGCEEAFLLNPWDLGATRDAAEAAEGISSPQMALWLLKSIEAQAGEDVEYLKHLAHVYKLNEDFTTAIRILERVRKLAPNDEGVSREINGLAANATIARSGMGNALKAKDAEIKEETFSPDLEDLAEQAMAPEQRLRNQIEAAPTRVGAYLELADLLRTQGKLEDAQKVLAAGLKANRDDVVLLTAHAEVQISRMHKAKDDLETRLRRSPDDPTIRVNLDKLSGMLNDYEVKEFRRRLALRPEDLALQMELGKRLARTGEHVEAIQAFQKARSAPELRVQALLFIGQSFEALGNLALAKRNLDDALKALDKTDTANWLELNYRLGCVCEAQGDSRQAEEHFQEVAAHDYGYKDVAERLRNLGKS